MRIRGPASAAFRSLRWTDGDAMSDELDRAAIALVGGMLAEEAGECRICHCHGEECRLPNNDLCCWVSKTRRLCNNPACLRAARLERKRLRHRAA